MDTVFNRTTIRSIKFVGRKHILSLNKYLLGTEVSGTFGEGVSLGFVSWLPALMCAINVNFTDKQWRMLPMSMTKRRVLSIIASSISQTLSASCTMKLLIKLLKSWKLIRVGSQDKWQLVLEPSIFTLHVWPRTECFYFIPCSSTWPNILQNSKKGAFVWCVQWGST